MKKIGVILVIMAVVLIGVWVWVMVSPNQASQGEIEPKTFVSQSDDHGEVTVDVTPVSLEPGKEVKFKIALNTHSVELNYDLLKASSLNDDKGDSLKAVSWSGGRGGHHLNGELVFPPLVGKAKTAQLTITSISGFDRRFTWNLL